MPEKYRYQNVTGPTPFGKLVLEAVEKQQITCYRLAKILGVRQSAVSAVILGKDLALARRYWPALRLTLGLSQEELEQAERESLPVEIGRERMERAEAIRFLLGKPAFDLDDAALGALVRKLAGGGQ